MRTSLDIDDDVLQAARRLAERQGSTAGRVISALARRGLLAAATTKRLAKVSRGGVPLLPSRGEVVALDHVRELMDRENL